MHILTSNRYLSTEKSPFADNSRAEPTIFFIDNISFSLQLLSGHLYGQSFFKTVQGPLSSVLMRYNIYYSDFYIPPL